MFFDRPVTVAHLVLEKETRPLRLLLTELEEQAELLRVLDGVPVTEDDPESDILAKVLEPRTLRVPV